MRDEAEHVLESIDESFRTARELEVPVVISHHKVVGTRSHGRSKETLLAIAEAMRNQPVCLDCYPYMASSTMLSYARTLICSRVIVSSSQPFPQFAGMDLDEVVREMGLPVEEAIAKLRPASAIYFSMDKADVQRILCFEHTMVGSDGLPHDIAPHPPVGMLPARARPLQSRPQAVSAGNRRTQNDRIAGEDLRFEGARRAEGGRVCGHHRVRSADSGRDRDLGETDSVRARHRRHHRHWCHRLARRQADGGKAGEIAEKVVTNVTVVSA